MTEVPKIVADRLRAGELARAASGPSHPDADLLTAFAEHTLLPAERDGILQHLGACQDCRDLIALALLPEPAALTPDAAEADAARTPAAAKPERDWLSAFAWPSLRWAALAAGVVLAGSIFLLRPNKHAAVVVSSSLPTAVAPAPSVPFQKTPQPMDQVSTLTRTDVAKAMPQSSLSRKRNAGQGAMRPAQSESGILIADARISAQIANAQKDSFGANKPSPVSPPTPDLQAPQSVTETVEVSAAAVEVNAAPSTASNLMARNEAPPVEKAKPALPEIGAEQIVIQETGANQQMQTSAARASGPTRSAAVDNTPALKKEAAAKQAFVPTFKVRIAAGLLQRSVDNGLNWQVGLRSDRPLLCYAAIGWDVWAGGEAGTLFHSIDGGATWVSVQPAVKGQSLSTDVVSITVQAPQVLISTSNHEIWSTTDGGQTWEKK